MPAHKTREQYVEAGRSPDDHEGNSRANVAAGRAVAGRAMPREAELRQEARLRVLVAVLRVVGMVQEEHLARQHRKGSRIVRERGPRRAPRARGPPGGGAPKEGVSRPALEGQAPMGAHDLVPLRGPLTVEMSRWLRLKKRGSVAWPLGCRKCDGMVVGTDRWAAFGRTVCEADAQPGQEWVQQAHELRPVAGGYQCGRCHLPVAAARYAVASAARCPAWTLRGPGGDVAGSTRGLRNWRTSGLPGRGSTVALAGRRLSLASL